MKQIFANLMCSVPTKVMILNRFEFHKEIDISHRLAATGPGRSIFARRVPDHGQFGPKVVPKPAPGPKASLYQV